VKRPRAPLLALGFAAGLLVPPAAAAAEGSHEHHPAASEIQALIDAASPGDVVHVEPGMYHGNLVVDVPVTLHGMGRPLIQGDGTGSVITVTAPGVVVSGLRIRGSAPGPVGGPSGVRIEAGATGAVVRDVVIEESYYGIAVFGTEGVQLLGNTVRGRAQAAIGDEGHAVDPDADEGAGHDEHAAGPGVFSRGDGISLWHARDVLVRGNDIASSRDGVFVSFGRNTLIDGNRVADGRYAVHSMFAEGLTISANHFEANLSGAVLMYGGRVLLLRNQIRDSHSPSTGFGVLLKDVEEVQVAENVVTGNRVGIQVDGPPVGAPGEIRIFRNTVALNGAGVSLYPSTHATFFANSFVENTVQVAAQGSGVAGKNAWSFEGVGNYWSDYRGYDLAGEGVGDMPYASGRSVEVLLRRAPVLEALASGPAFGLLGAVADRWVERDPIVVDRLPLMRPVSPAAATPSSATAAGLLGALGLGGLVAAGLAVAAIRRPLGPGRARRGV